MESTLDVERPERSSQVTGMPTPKVLLLEKVPRRIVVSTLFSFFFPEGEGAFFFLWPLGELASLS